MFVVDIVCCSHFFGVVLSSDNNLDHSGWVKIRMQLLQFTNISTNCASLCKTMCGNCWKLAAYFMTVPNTAFIELYANSFVKELVYYLSIL